MRVAGITPTGQERVFGREEIIVSKTDTKGRLTYANDVFVSVSRYERSDLMGQPHSIVRHPGMPRGIFHLLWQSIAAGQEIFAYIDNLAADGANYWVLAHVTPSFGPGHEIVGYHSNRRLPEARAVREVTTLYARMLAHEARLPGRSNEVAAASAAWLVEQLAEQDLTYDRYVWGLITEHDACVA